jgi:hypothetical protein
MITKLEAGHTYKDKGIGLFIFLEEDEDGYIIYSPGDGRAHGVRRNRIDLSTLVEVCYVNGEEMIVGGKYEVLEGGGSWALRLFSGVLQGESYFHLPGCHPVHWDHWRSVQPVTTYTLVKTIDGKEVSRTEVSKEKAKDLC